MVSSLGAAIPQRGTATTAELAQLREAGPVAAGLIDSLGLDHIFHSALFVAIAVLTSASLLVVIIEQLKRLRSQWAPRLTEAHFRSAAFREEFEVIPTPGRLIDDADARVQIRTEGRIGLLGSPIFHLGLLLLIVAGTLQALFGASAVVELIEGETLAPVASAWSGRFPGVLGKPVQLDSPVTLNSVKVLHYKDGTLRDLRIQLAFPNRGKTKVHEIAVNHDLKIRNTRLFVGSDFGPAALIECEQSKFAPKLGAVLLTDVGHNVFEGTFSSASGWIAFLRVRLGSDGAHPGSVAVRVMKENVLLFAEELGMGQTIALPGGEKLALHGTPFWARLRGSRDSALWLAYASFTLIMVGAVLMFTIIKVDFCVAVAPNGEKTRVFVALKPQRLAPLFQERFDKFVREQKASLQNMSGKGESAAGCDPSTKSWLNPNALQAVSSLLIIVGTGVLSGCGESPRSEARRLVEHYNQVVSEAYRRGDVSLVEPVVGPKEGKKLLGLIGVRMDAGITLDSRLTSLEITGVEKAGDEMRVQTTEHWKYRDRKIGTGALVGEESNDDYEMLYIFKKADKTWLMDEIRFTSEPKVSRTKLPFPNQRTSDAHSNLPKFKNKETKQ